MDNLSTQPLPFRTRIDIINSLTGQHQCLLIPNPYANITAQVWANPDTRRASLKINGTSLSSADLLNSHEAFLLLEVNESLGALGKTLDGIEEGYTRFSAQYQFKVKRDSLIINELTDNNKPKLVMKVQDNYRANGPAIVRPNPNSAHPPGTKGYRANAQPVSPLYSKMSRHLANEVNSLSGKLISRAGKTLGVVGKLADTVEVGQHIQNQQYGKAASKVGGIGSSWAGAKVGGRVGMALPIPHPLGKAGAVVILSIAGAFGGEKIFKITEEWLFMKATEKAPEPFKAFPADIHNKLTGISISSEKLFNGSGDDVFAYRTLPDGKVIPIRHSDMTRD